MVSAALVGQVIQSYRLRKGMSQEVLSGLAGLDRTHYSKIERGLRSPTLDTLFKGIPNAVIVFVVPDPLSDKSTGAVHKSQRNASVDLEGLTVIFIQRLLVFVVRHTSQERPCAEIVHRLGQIVII